MKLERSLLGAGTLVAALLLGRFALDFARWMPVWLTVPSWGLVAVTLFVAGRNALPFASPASPASPAGRAIPPLARGALFAMVPLGFVGSSLDCMGLSLDGCTLTCSLLKMAWFPALLVACTVAATTRSRYALVVVLALSFVSLVPHCICRNPVNAWWMDHLGASPMCLGWGFVASLVALGALVTRAHVRAALGVSGAITTGTLGFFVGHHYFHFPW